MLSYIQEESANIWKENILKDLELGNWKYKTVEEFLVDLKKKFDKGDEEAIKITKLKRLK